MPANEFKQDAVVADAQPVFVLTAAQFLHVAAEVLLQAVEAKANLAANVFAKALSAALASPLISSSYSIGQAGGRKVNAGRFVEAQICKGELGRSGTSKQGRGDGGTPGP